MHAVVDHNARRWNKRKSVSSATHHLHNPSSLVFGRLRSLRDGRVSGCFLIGRHRASEVRREDGLAGIGLCRAANGGICELAFEVTNAVSQHLVLPYKHLGLGLVKGALVTSQTGLVAFAADGGGSQPGRSSSTGGSRPSMEIGSGHVERAPGVVGDARRSWVWDAGVMGRLGRLAGSSVAGGFREDSRLVSAGCILQSLKLSLLLPDGMKQSVDLCLLLSLELLVKLPEAWCSVMMRVAAAGDHLGRGDHERACRLARAGAVAAVVDHLARRRDGGVVELEVHKDG